MHYQAGQDRMWYYEKRQEIIERIFGTIKRQWDMDRTSVKGKQHVETEYRLAAISYNLTSAVSVLGIERVKKKLKMLLKGMNLPFCKSADSLVADIQQFVYFIILKLITARNSMAALNSWY